MSFLLFTFLQHLRYSYRTYDVSSYKMRAWPLLLVMVIFLISCSSISASAASRSSRPRIRIAPCSATTERTASRSTRSSPTVIMRTPARDRHPSLIEQRRQIGEPRVLGEILERDCTVERDHELERRQRRAADVEEVIAPADLVPGDTEHVGPSSG